MPAASQDAGVPSSIRDDAPAVSDEAERAHGERGKRESIFTEIEKVNIKSSIFFIFHFFQPPQSLARFSLSLSFLSLFLSPS